MKQKMAMMVILAAVMVLSGCELLRDTVEYSISGNSTSVTVGYQDEDGTLVEVTVSSPWSTEFEVGMNSRPFLAFMEIDNAGIGDVTANILEDSDVKATTVALGGGPRVSLYAIVR